jgi:autotransporter-associated beta strand protein
VTWRVGGLNTTATFAGNTANNVGFIKEGTGTWTWTGTNSHTSATTVSNGTLLVQGIAAGATGTFTVAPAGTLGGTATLGGATTVNGRLSPGSNAIGTLTFTNTLTFGANGTAFIEINKSTSAKDLVTVGGTLTFGGTLQVTNLSGTLTNGDSFKIFNAAAYPSTFATLKLPALGTGLAWNTNALYTNGTLSVIVFMTPRFNSVVLAGTNLVLSGNGGMVNSNYYVLASTNLARPLAQWTPIATNQFGPNGSFNFTNGVSSGTPQRFYLLQVP